MSETVDTVKRIYFVRHGETDSNVAKTVQPPTQVLNETGLVQAGKIAERVAGLDVTAIVASTFTRADQTAAIIAHRIGQSYETSELFREVGSPRSLHGELRANDAYRVYSAAFETNLRDPAWHFEDEENPHDVVERCRKAKEFLETYSSPDILVVTHGQFLKYFIAHILLGDAADPLEHHELIKRLYPSNVGLTICRIEDRVWDLLTFNDYAHLAE